MKKILCLMLSICIVFGMVTVSYAKIGDVLGYSKYTDIMAYINDYPIASYNINGYTVIVAEDLRNYGFDVVWNENYRTLNISRNVAGKINQNVSAPKYSGNLGQNFMPYLETDIRTYVNNKLVTSYNIGGRTVIYIDDLKAYGNVVWSQETRTIKVNVPNLTVAEVNNTNISSTNKTTTTTTQTKHTVTHNEYSFESIRKFEIECTGIIRGSQANTIVNSENSFNDKPSANQEWILLEFYVKYISSTGGNNDSVKGSDIIYYDDFFTKSKSKVPAYDTATLGDRYKAYDVFKVEMYPGSSSKIVIGLLTDKNLGDLLLRVPNKSENDVTWIPCVASNSISNSNVSNSISYEEDDLYVNNSSKKYYSGTTALIPTYTSITGISLKETVSLDDGGMLYKYRYTNSDDVGDYWGALMDLGWKILENDDKGTMDVFESSMIKGSNFIILNVYLDTDEVWITFN